MAEAIRTTYLRAASLAAGILALTGTLSAQEAVKHLNPVIEKLAAGKPFIGFQTGDLSLQNARTLARADIDYVYLEMEHAPMDFGGLQQFSVGMIDKATILKKGNAQPNVAIFARFPPYGREQAQWFVKQALDIGLMGVIFNGIDDAEQAATRPQPWGERVAWARRHVRSLFGDERRRSAWPTVEQKAAERERRVPSSATAYDEVAEAVEARLDRERVRRCLASLTELQRESVTLAYYGGYTYREVAELLDVAIGTVKTRMRDGLIRLRDCLGVDG